MSKAQNQYFTNNMGHDVAKTRRAMALKNNGYDVDAIMAEVKNHTTIAPLLKKGYVQVVRIGQNFVVKCVDSLYVKQGNKGIVEKKHHLNDKVTVVQVVNNIITSKIGITNYGKTLFWINNPSARIYKKEIIVGADILTREWTLKNYSQPMIVSLNERQKFEKYGYYKWGK